MALRMEVQTVAGGAYTEVDLAALRACNFRLQVGYSHPRTLRWKHYASQQTYPVGIRNFVRFWDDEYGSTSSPQFEGFIWEVTPGQGANEVMCVAYDPTQMAGRDIPIMSLPWTGATTPNSSAVPRLVYNVKNDNDDDYAFERGHDGTVGEIIAGVLEDAILPLRNLNAAPSASDAYVSGDLSLLTYRPQEKIVFESESLFSGIERLAQYHPAFKLLWIPGDRKWRWRSVQTSPTLTLTLNHFNESSGSGNQFRVLSMQLGRSLEGRWPAVQYFGPQVAVTEAFYTSNGSLSITSQVFLENYTDTGGSHDVFTPLAFQITQSEKRAGAKLLPDNVAVPMGSYQFHYSRSPTLQYSFDNGVTWSSVLNPPINNFEGTVALNGPIYFYVDPAPIFGSTQRYFAPTDWRLIYAPYTTPLSIRYPASGFDGTSNSVAGMTAPERIYDEMLAIGYERGIPVTSAARIAEFQILAAARHEMQKDIAYAGGCLLDGIHYEFQHLNRRINIEGVNGDGDHQSTGWENINAILTDVEYDFEERTTQLMFSSDQLEVVGLNVGLLKEFLRIRPLQRMEHSHLAGVIAFNGNSFIYQVTEVAYVDPRTGEYQAPIM